MNISGILNSTYLSNIISTKSQSVDTVSSATKIQNIKKPDTISSATKRNGGDHYFEAKA
ncbi:hypothetical protein [Clostridium sp.]|uniref:hypothetical protein n=1 Tax=Clostridium sp. TaxID=1506 RepID=UPI002634EBDC|nr:hypothetical protein [Clostridium sp.]